MASFQVSASLHIQAMLQDNERARLGDVEALASRFAVLDYLALASHQQVKLEDWMISPCDVDFGQMIGACGLGTCEFDLEAEFFRGLDQLMAKPDLRPCEIVSPPQPSPNGGQSNINPLEATKASARVGPATHIDIVDGNHSAFTIRAREKYACALLCYFTPKLYADFFPIRRSSSPSKYPNRPTELSFAKGEILEIEKPRGRWWPAKKNDGTKGVVPANHMVLLPPHQYLVTGKVKDGFMGSVIGGVRRFINEELTDFFA
ncbi:hypothetical protein FB45DRAFT_1055724 [Roridomyces roridus]|uniref:SH3 domain-containing protein n=1 Tax=Roridomyces roridus TaxID=1738132 RepID=A0AAD7FPH9_9AGAR|nr:hypothetical protein FB45DRAFT_1055724 [Roridomyces roridus]